MKTPFNKTYKTQNTRLVPKSFKKAVISSVYVNNYTVDVYFIGNNQTIIRNIPVANTVDITTINPGDRCKVDIFDETNPSDMVLAYTF